MSLMSVNDVAKYIGCHRTSVYRFMRENGLPYIVVGSRRKFEIGDVKKWVNGLGKEGLK